MLSSGDLRIALHLVPSWILTLWGSVHIEETMLWWLSLWYITLRTSQVNKAPPMPLRASSHPGSPNYPSCSALAWYSFWPGSSPWDESLACQRRHAAATPLSQGVHLRQSSKSLPFMHPLLCDEDPRYYWQKYRPISWQWVKCLTRYKLDISEFALTQ